MQRPTAILVAGVLVVAAVAAPAAAGAPTRDATVQDDPAGTPSDGTAPATAPDDPNNDTIGWEQGYWYNESVDVDRSDGLNESELQAVKYRTMARIEVIRDREFDFDVPVRVISREEWADRLDRAPEPGLASRRRANAKWEATFMINESTDANAVSEQNSEGYQGLYLPGADRILIISDNATAPKMDEVTLSQELYHAMQDQAGAFRNLNYSTRELHNAADAVIEGDANLVDYFYARRCGNATTGWDCLLPSNEGAPAASDGHVGMSEVILHPYTDGVAWVWQVYQESGWDGVDRLYENPPASTEQVIHPEKYGNDTPDYPTVEDRSDGTWHVPDPTNSPEFASFGEAGLYVTFWYPSYEVAPKNDRGQVTGRAEVVIPVLDHFRNPINSRDARNYDHPVSEGWDGDRLVPYARKGQNGSEELGYVWKLRWDTEADAEEFVAAYEQLLDHRGANAVEGLSAVYRIPDGKEFGDAFAVERTGDTVTIVNAPTLAELNGVRDGTITAADYAGTDGEVSTQELRTALSHWVTEKIDSETFQSVVHRWVRT